MTFQLQQSKLLFLALPKILFLNISSYSFMITQYSETSPVILKPDYPRFKEVIKGGSTVSPLNLCLILPDKWPWICLALVCQQPILHIEKARVFLLHQINHFQIWFSFLSLSCYTCQTFAACSIEVFFCLKLLFNCKCLRYYHRNTHQFVKWNSYLNHNIIEEFICRHVTKTVWSTKCVYHRFSICHSHTKNSTSLLWFWRKFILVDINLHAVASV